MKKIYRLEGLECANCAAKMEKSIGEIKGVKSANLNFITAKLAIEFEDDADVTDILSQSEKIAKKLEPDVKIKSL